MNTLLLYEQRTTEIDDNLIYKQAAINQECFIRDVIGYSLCKAHTFSVSCHRSKSIVLPVYGILSRSGVSMIIRDNFYDYKVSVILPTALPEYYLDESLFTDGYNDKKIKSVYCEGFKEEWVYGPYIPTDKSCTKFTVELNSQYKLYTMIYLIELYYKNFTMQGEMFSKDRSKEEIAASIKEIYTANGKYEFREEDGKSNPVMKGWHILNHTETCLSDIRNKSGKYDSVSICEDPDELAEYICKYPELLRAFLLEEQQFLHKF